MRILCLVFFLNSCLTTLSASAQPLKKDPMSEFKMPKIESYEEFEKMKHNAGLWETAAHQILEQHGLAHLPLAIINEGSNIVFGIGSDRILKIFVPALRDQFESEKLVLNHIYGKLSILTPKLEHVGELDGWPYLIMSRIEGRTLEGLWEKLPFENKVSLIRKLGNLIREVHSIPTNGLESIDSHWASFLENQIVNCAERHRSLNLPVTMVDGIPAYLEATSPLLPRNIRPVLLTGEYTPMNLIVKETNGFWDLHGLIDFGDSLLGLREYDLLGPGAFLIQGDQRLARELLISYGYTQEELNPDLSRKLTALTLLHKHSNLNIQIRIPNWQSKATTPEQFEKLIWGFPTPQ